MPQPSTCLGRSGPDAVLRPDLGASKAGRLGADNLKTAFRRNAAEGHPAPPGGGEAGAGKLRSRRVGSRGPRREAGPRPSHRSTPEPRRVFQHRPRFHRSSRRPVSDLNAHAISRSGISFRGDLCDDNEPCGFRACARTALRLTRETRSPRRGGRGKRRRLEYGGLLRCRRPFLRRTRACRKFQPDFARRAGGRRHSPRGFPDGGCRGCAAQ